MYLGCIVQLGAGRKNVRGAIACTSWRARAKKRGAIAQKSAVCDRAPREVGYLLSVLRAWRDHIAAWRDELLR